MSSWNLGANQATWGKLLRPNPLWVRKPKLTPVLSHRKGPLGLSDDPNEGAPELVVRCVRPATPDDVDPDWVPQWVVQVPSRSQSTSIASTVAGAFRKLIARRA